MQLKLRDVAQYSTVRVSMLGTTLVSQAIWRRFSVWSNALTLQ